MFNDRKLPEVGKSVYVLLLFIAVAIIYGQFLWNPVVFDDLDFFREGSEALRHFGSTFAPFEIRWLPYATLAWTTKLFGLEMVGLRIGNLLLHAATVVALFFFLSNLFRHVLTNKTGAVHGATLSLNWIAFFAALLFALHPVAVYGAAYLVQRSIVMATLFAILALYAYMRGLTEERPRWLWGSVGLYYLAVFSKEHVVMLPAVMLVLTLLLVKPSAALFKRLWVVYAVCALIALFVVFQKLGLLGSVYEIAAPEMLEKIEIKNAYSLSVLTQCFLFFEYWLLWLLPNPAWMSVDMREPFASSVFSPYLLALVAFLSYGVIGFRLLLKRGEQGLLGFALLFPWLLFATEFSTVRIQESFVLYRSYLWMAGSFAALPFLLMHLRTRLVFAGLLLCALVLSMLSVNRLTTFSHPLLLWDDAEVLVKNKHELPGVDRIYYNRAKYLSDIKRYQESLADYQTALTLRPNYVHYHYGVALGYLNMGRYPDARMEFGKAIEMEPKHVRAYYGHGLANYELGDQAAALADFEKSCEMGWKSGCTKVQILKEKTGG